MTIYLSKEKMEEQDIDFFDYMNENKRPPHLNKDAYIDESFVNYKKTGEL